MNIQITRRQGRAADRLSCPLTFDGLVRLLQSQGYDVGREAGNRQACWAGTSPRFRAKVLGETTPGAGAFTAFQLLYSERLSPAGVALAERAAAERMIDSQVVAAGDLIQLRLHVSLGGGLGEAGLRHRFECWEADLREFRAAIAEACGLVDPQSLH